MTTSRAFVLGDETVYREWAMSRETDENRLYVLASERELEDVGRGHRGDQPDAAQEVAKAPAIELEAPEYLWRNAVVGHDDAMISTPTVGTSWPELAERLTRALHPLAAPVAITFLDAPSADISVFEASMPEPTPDGRTGRVESGWVTPEAFPTIPAVTTRPASIVYGPLAETPVDPNVILLRLNAQAMMVVTDALPDLHIEGKPQCHIIAVAHKHGRVAASVGCALSRARTGMGAHALTCAIHAALAAEVIERVERAADIDGGGGPLRRPGRPALPVGGGTIGAVLAVPSGSERNG